MLPITSEIVSQLPRATIAYLILKSVIVIHILNVPISLAIQFISTTHWPQSNTTGVQSLFEMFWL